MHTGAAWSRKNGAQSHKGQCPTYFAYSVRALSGSLVPLMIARPSSNTVNSYGSPFSISWNFRRNLLYVTSPDCYSTPARNAKSSFPFVRWVT